MSATLEHRQPGERSGELLTAGIVGLGWFNRRRLLPALDRAAHDGADPGRTGVLLRRTLRTELVLGITALAVTGALAWAATRVAIARAGDADRSLIMFAGGMREHPHEHETR